VGDLHHRVLVIGSLADVSAFYIYRLLDLETLKNSREAVVILAIVIIVIMTAICVIGTELSARVQRVMVFAQVGALVLLVVVGAIQLIFGGAPETSITVSLSWLNPFEAPSYSALLSALLLGVFIYWGWESAVNLTEETEDGSHAAGRAGAAS
jgi:amino acid transporter